MRIEAAEKFLKNVATDGKLPKNSVVSIREIESAYGTEDPRYSVIMATQNIKEEIAHNASNDENFKKKIRHGVPPHVRQEKVRLRNYRIMSSQQNAFQFILDPYTLAVLSAPIPTPS